MLEWFLASMTRSGPVVAVLDKKGLRENTLILFTATKVARVMADMSNVTLHCDIGPYREGKVSDVRARVSKEFDL